MNRLYVYTRLCGLVARVAGCRSRGPGFDSRCYQIFWKVVGLERGPLSLVRITEELLEPKSSGSGYRKPRLTAMGICCAGHVTRCLQKLTLTSPTSGGRSVCIVRLQTKATEFSLVLVSYTGCPRRNVPDFGRAFLMLKYTDITKNTYVPSWTVTEIMAREMFGLLAVPRTVLLSWLRFISLTLTAP
jgi:hypothetical protein